MMSRIIRPKNWHDFQHYKGRMPPWIKLHRRLLDDFEFHTLPVASRALAPMLWLIASEHEDGDIDAGDRKLAFRLRMTAAELTEALDPLVSACFFDVLHDDSAALAEHKQHATPEKESEAQGKAQVKAEGEARKRATALPEGFPDAEAQRRAMGFWTEKGRLDLAHSVRDEAEHFRDHHLKLGNRFPDWPAAWRTWMRNALKFNRLERVNGHGRRESPYEQTERIARELIREDAGHEGANSGADSGARAALRPPGDERSRASSVARNLLRGPETHD